MNDYLLLTSKWSHVDVGCQMKTDSISMVEATSWKIKDSVIGQFLFWGLSKSIFSHSGGHCKCYDSNCTLVCKNNYCTKMQKDPAIG